MSSELNPAIVLLETKYRDGERSQAELRTMINYLRKEAGLDAMPESGVSGEQGAPGIMEIRPDTFYGKKLQTAVREYLEMRRKQNLGPAKPREIYDAVVAGGFQFEAQTPDIALVGLRALLRKRTQFFHKLPNGTYGMTSWYPHAKAQKIPTAGSGAADADDDDDQSEEETASPEPEEAV